MGASKAKVSPALPSKSEIEVEIEYSIVEFKR
jgi:hypothetical protein